MCEQQKTYHHRSALVTVALGFALFAGSAYPGTILDSKHDFSDGTDITVPGQQICVVCHTPHNGTTLLDQSAPLWNHDLSVGGESGWIMYSSPTFDADTISDQPTGHSVLCLSCHDGSIAVDAFGGGDASTFIDSINPAANLTTDLSDDHPISIFYDSTLVTKDPALYEPTTRDADIGDDPTKPGTIAENLLFGTNNNELQCSSCHDVHNVFTQDEDKLLKITRAESKLCLTCHKK